MDFMTRTAIRIPRNYFTFSSINVLTALKKLSTYKSFYALKTAEQNALNSHISAYIDNELDLDENIKVKKMIITKPDIREKIEKIYTLRHLLKDSFDKTQPKQDYSKKIVRHLYFDQKYKYNKDILYSLISFVCLSIMWIIMLIFSV